MNKFLKNNLKAQVKIFLGAAIFSGSCTLSAMKKHTEGSWSTAGVIKTFILGILLSYFAFGFIRGILFVVGKCGDKPTYPQQFKALGIMFLLTVGACVLMFVFVKYGYNQIVGF